jgi:acyl-CoA thioesterase-2
VVAIQNGHAILNLAVSFQREELGYEHQDEMPAAPAPESLPSDLERARAFADRLPPFLRERALMTRPIEMRQVSAPTDPLQPPIAPPHRMVWLRAIDRLPDDSSLHRSMLTYASDYGFVTTALLPHGVSWLSPEMQIASLDHMIWFHQRFRADEWLLHVIDSPAAHGGRGLVRGRIFSQDGRLVASTAQEGLIRRR